MSRMQFGLKNRQKGAAALITTVLLALVLGVVTLNTTNIGMMEQRITGNELRSREAQEAAEAGLEYAVAWASKNVIPWPSSTSLAFTCRSSGSSDTGCPTLQPITLSTTTTGEGYNLDITYSRASTSSNTIEVTSISTGAADGAIIAQVKSSFAQTNYLTPKGKGASPFVINGCLSNVTGNPDIDTGSPPKPAITTSQTAACIDTGKFNKHPPPDLGSTVPDTFPATSTPAWDYIFTIPLSAAISIADSNGYRLSTGTIPNVPAAGKEPFYVWDADTHISGDYGSATKPVVIIVTSGYCPKVNGGPIIYGFIYFPQTCSDQGWGNARIYGTVIAEGNITKVTANSLSIGVDGSGGTNMSDKFIDGAVRYPGTWKDW